MLLESSKSKGGSGAYVPPFLDHIKKQQGGEDKQQAPITPGNPKVRYNFGEFANNYFAVRTLIFGSIEENGGRHRPSER